MHLPLGHLLTKQRRVWDRVGKIQSVGHIQPSACFFFFFNFIPLPVFIHKVLLGHSIPIVNVLSVAASPTTIQNSLKEIFSHPCSRPSLCSNPSATS